MFITAVDLGSSRFKSIVADVGKGGCVIVKAVARESRGVKRGEVIYPEEAVKSLFKILDDVKRFDRRCLKNLVFSISGVRSRVYISRGSVSIPRPDHEILSEDVDRVVKESMAFNLPVGWQIIHSFPRGFVIDDIEVDGTAVEGLSGRKLAANVVLIAVFSSAYKNFVRLTNLVLGKKGDIGGNVFFAPLASDRAVLTRNQRELGVVLVDVGFGTTSIVAYQDGKMLNAVVLPVGSGLITSDLAIGLKCSIEAAEKIKCQLGAALSRGVSVKDVIDLSEYEEGQTATVSRRFVAEIIEARTREIFSLVKEQVSAMDKSLHFPAGVVVTGGGAKLPGILDIVRQELRLPAHVGFPRIDELEFSNATVQETLNDPEMSVACGLLLHRLDMLRPGGLGRKETREILEPWYKRILRTILALD